MPFSLAEGTGRGYRVWTGGSGVRKGGEKMRKNKTVGNWIPAVLGTCALLSACGQNDGGKAAIGIAETAREYEMMPYGTFRERTGNEAEFYHGVRFIGEIPDSSLCVVYGGRYDEDIAGAVLAEDDLPIRIQGELGALMDGMEEEMPLAEFAAALSPDGAAEAVFELLEGGGTAYYVGNEYAQIQFDSDRNGEYDRLLLISLDESMEEIADPKSTAWLEALPVHE